MPVFPPAASVEVRLDGRPLLAYVRAFAADGHVYAPLSPLFTRVAQRLWFDGDTLVMERDGRRARVRLPARPASAYGATVVAVAPLLRALGARVGYDARARVLAVTLPAPWLATPRPFVPGSPQVAPRVVFTPEPVATPRPTWRGSPLPRRTPLPFPPLGGG